jgi:ABC-type multidrug transport system fused ATPase/permease subunit
MAAHDKLILLAISCACILAIFFLEGLFTFARKYFMAGAGERATNDIRQEAFGHLQMLEHRTDRSADLVVRLTSDIDSLKLLLTQQLHPIILLLSICITMF